MDSVARLLAAHRAGDKRALDRIVPLVYDELRRIAVSYLSRERVSHTLQPTALVNEAYLRLVQNENLELKDRAHFIGIAARLMRQILVDYARKHRAKKRGGLQKRVTLTGGVALARDRNEVDLLMLDDALESLDLEEPGLARLVELRYFGGLSIEETAEVLGSSPTTVKREWAVARVWLRRLMVGEKTP